MESLYSMSACGHLESSSSMHSPSYPCSWNTSPIPGRLDVSMTLDARFTMLFISGILLQNGGNVSAGGYRFSTLMDISGPVNCGIIHVRMLYEVGCLIEAVMSLKATREMKEGILKEIIQDQDDLIGVDSVVNFAWAELQEHVDALSMAIKWLTK